MSGGTDDDQSLIIARRMVRHTSVLDEKRVYLAGSSCVRTQSKLELSARRCRQTSLAWSSTCEDNECEVASAKSKSVRIHSVWTFLLHQLDRLGAKASRRGSFESLVASHSSSDECRIHRDWWRRERSHRSTSSISASRHGFDAISRNQPSCIVLGRETQTFLLMKYRSKTVGQLSHSLKRTVLKMRVCPTDGSGVTGHSSYKVGKKYCHNASLVKENQHFDRSGVEPLLSLTVAGQPTVRRRSSPPYYIGFEFPRSIPGWLRRSPAFRSICLEGCFIIEPVLPAFILTGHVLFVF